MVWSSILPPRSNRPPGKANTNKHVCHDLCAVLAVKKNTLEKTASLWGATVLQKLEKKWGTKKKLLILIPNFWQRSLLCCRRAYYILVSTLVLKHYSIKTHLSGSNQLYQHCVISIFEIFNLKDVYLNYWFHWPDLATKSLSIFVCRPQCAKTSCSK